jgi:hypothetical protein
MVLREELMFLDINEWCMTTPTTKAVGFLFKVSGKIFEK